MKSPILQLNSITNSFINKTSYTSYDAVGNIIQTINQAGGAKEQYEYDEYGQLTKVTDTKDEYYTYSYDAQGDRSSLERWVERSFDRNEWYEKLSETGLEDMKALLNDKNSTQTFDALRYQFYVRLQACTEQLDNTQAQMTAAKAEADKPFSRAEELKEKSKRLAELTKLLKMDEKDRELLDGEPDEGDETEKPQRKVMCMER